MTQILVGTPATISASWYVDGTLTDPGTVTLTLTREDGTALYTDAATTGTGAAARTKALDETTDTNLLDFLTAVWTSTTLGEITTYVEIVGQLLFTESEARAFDNAALTSATDYTDADIMNARSMIAEAFAQIAGKPFGRRYRRVVLDGCGKSELLLPNLRLSAVRSIEYRNSGEQTWTAFTSTELADVLIEPWGRLTRETLGTFPKGRRNIRVGYEHGHQPIPFEISRAALIVLVDVLRSSNIDDRATSFTDELGSRTFVVTAGVRGALYSLPQVNAAFERPGMIERVPGIG